MADTPANAAEPAPAAKATESEPTSVLGDAPKPPEPPAAPAAAPADPAAPPAVEPPAPISYEFTYPDGTTPPAAEDLKPFTDLLNDARVAPEIGQKLIDLHLAEQNKLIGRLETQAQATWTDTRKEWVDQIKADPELGGNRFQTAIGLAKEVIQRFGGDESQLGELRNVLNLTGAGDHPAVARFLYRIGMALREPQTPAVGQPIQQATTRAQRRYANSIPPQSNGAA